MPICIVALCSCAEQSSPSQSEGDDPVADGVATQHEPTPPLVTEGDEVLVACGPGPAFAASAMGGGVSGLADEAAVAAGLQRLADEAGIDAPAALRHGGVPGAEWRVLGSDAVDDAAVLTVGVGGWDGGGPRQDGQYVVLERADDAWHATGWGDCTVEPVLRSGLSWAQFRAADNGFDPAATSLEVEAWEQECTSARNPEPFLREPVVVEDEYAVTVYWTTESPAGDQNCPGNPSARRSISLDDPLGDRVILDGSAWPPGPVPTS